MLWSRHILANRDASLRRFVLPSNGPLLYYTILLRRRHGVRLGLPFLPQGIDTVESCAPDVARANLVQFSPSLHTIYTHPYIYIHICICIYIYTYIYVYKLTPPPTRCSVTPSANETRELDIYIALSLSQFFFLFFFLPSHNLLSHHTIIHSHAFFMHLLHIVIRLYHRFAWCSPMWFYMKVKKNIWKRKKIFSLLFTTKNYGN